MRFSIVIPAYNSGRYLTQCLQGCLAQDYAGAYEIILVDDGSRDNTRQVASRPGIRYLYQENRGPAAARNKGWRAGNGDIVCFTDADCVPKRSWLSKLNSLFKAHDADAVGGGYRYDLKGRLGRLIQDEIEKRHVAMDGFSDFLGSFNMAVKREALQAVNGFDETYLRASAEDNDLCYRLKRTDRRLWFDRTVRVSHLHHWTFCAYLTAQARHGYWRMKLYRTHRHMIRGDRYAGKKDFLLPPLAALSLILPAVGWPWPTIAVLGAMAALGVRKPFPLSALVFGRAYFRAAGMIAGLIRFWAGGRR